jgi:uncharacterized membrane protein YozB (DUF420 family)
MQVEGFFGWLGHAIGSVIRFVVDLFSGFLGGIGDAIDDFFAGMAQAVGINQSVFSFLFLALGLWLLYKGVRALMRKAFVAGIVWLLLGLVLLGWLIS